MEEHKGKRRCIRCGKWKSLGHFPDNWRHKVNICQDCINSYERDFHELGRERKRRNEKESRAPRQKYS